MKHFALFTGCIFLALIAGATASSALLSEPKLGLGKTASVDETIYTDSDLHSLIMNNLELLTTQKLTESNEQMINRYGEPVLSQKILLNYLFLIDTDSELFNSETFTANKKPVKVEACTENNLESCIVGRLYDRERQDSVVSEFENTHGKNAHIANHIYSSMPSVSDLYNQYSFSVEYDTFGNAVIVENRSGRKFPVNKNLSKCINDVTGGSIKFDLANGVITTNERSIVFTNETRADLKTFAEDMCFMISMPKFIIKDTTPALFTFILQGLRNVEKNLDVLDKSVLHQVVELGYNQFQKVLGAKLGEQHVTGQILLTSSAKNIEAHAQKKLSEGFPRQIRVLTETTQAAGDDAPATLTAQQVVFRIYGIVFFLVLAVILGALASIQVEKDTLVYSKFLTVDQRK
eukprot:CAMPEP_0176475194 /NCGR_PEP_ID=MMETSP0127-20121128/43468_1 /TAXON_ID=938130 /ORGANISM="Platyophrya macrostoma, Strain WH" /LENGTH=404 /DNA_ID=CAMNT_0017870757 /DNA_START=35 /DNA_END=1249 /DNA_ORIENTATION=-